MKKLLVILGLALFLGACSAAPAEDNSLMMFQLEAEELVGKAGTALAFPKGSEWVAKVNEALATLTNDGTLEVIDNKWFGQEEPETSDYVAKVLESTEGMETIVVLTSPDYPPYESIEPDGSYVGFDIDLMEALAVEMGVIVEWKEQSFDGIVAAISAGQGDMAISGMNVSEERKQSVDFSNIYKEDGFLYAVVAKVTDGLSSIEDLEGKIIGVQTGTVQESAMNSIADTYGFEVKSYQTFNTIIQDILNDRVDALVIDSTNAQTYVDEQ